MKQKCLEEIIISNVWIAIVAIRIWQQQDKNVSSKNHSFLLFWNWHFWHFIVAAVYQMSGSIYCGDCFAKLNALKCESCHKDIEGEYVEVNDKKYHKDCWKCSECEFPISGAFFQVNGEPMCQTCHANQVKCKTCGERMEGRYIITLGHKYHEKVTSQNSFLPLPKTNLFFILFFFLLLLRNSALFATIVKLNWMTNFMILAGTCTAKLVRLNWPNKRRGNNESIKKKNCSNQWIGIELDDITIFPKLHVTQLSLLIIFFFLLRHK